MSETNQREKLTKAIVKDAGGLTEKLLELVIPLIDFSGNIYKLPFAGTGIILSAVIVFFACYHLINDGLSFMNEASFLILLAYLINFINFRWFIMPDEHAELSMWFSIISDRICEYSIQLSIGLCLYRGNNDSTGWVIIFFAFIFLSFKHYDNFYRWKFNWDMKTGINEIFFISLGDRYIILALLLYSGISRKILVGAIVWGLLASVLRPLIHWRNYFKSLRAG